MVPAKKPDPKGTTAKRPVTTVARIADELRKGIKTGRFAPGQRLIEADLTRLLGVSRGPLREAMARLAGDGLVTIEPNRGVTVKTLTRAEVRGIAAIREMLEGLAARLAAEHITVGSNRAEFRKAWAEMSSGPARTNPSDYVDANERFHTTIVRIGGNAPLEQLLEQIRTPLFRFQFRSRFTTVNLDRGHKDHSAIAEAILAGDAEEAERVMRRHLRNSTKLIESLPDDAFG
jgi:DNA-binding GntR family transcriptional regulator